MTQRPVSTLATLFGLLAVIGVLLPWHSVVAIDAKGVGELISCTRGYGGEFNGLWTLILAAIGTFLILWFALRRTNPGLSRALLFAAAILFAMGAGLTISDFTRELPTREVTAGGRTLSEGRAMGMWVTLIGTAVAFLLTAVTVMSPKTPYKD